jgi:hypothetical protein
MKCVQCNSDKFLEREMQKFRNGTEHVRVNCTRCGVFVAFEKQQRLKENGDFFITLYTDASVRPLEKVVQVAWRGKCAEGDVEGFVNREFSDCVMNAEMWAIFYGIQDALIHYPNLQGFFVNSDNLDCVRMFWDFRKPKIHNRVREPYDKIKEKLAGRWIRCKHVKAHTGGNDVRSWMNRRVDNLTRKRM